ncbi:MAG: ISNCY family transposase [Nitrospirae bacterium]|nr:ISNCY family transposase [Nitrospirota bacterium]
MKEVKRAEVIQRAVSGEVTVQATTELLGLCERQVYRLKSSFKLKGVKGLIHGNRDKVSPRRLDSEIGEKVVKLAKGEYEGYNDSFFTEKLGEEEGIRISREKVRQILRKEGIGPKRKRRRPKHRTRRERKPESGMMLQTDGSRHDWLQGRGEELTLIGAIDDATNEVPYALFAPCETTEGYMKMLMEIAKEKGLPLSLYADKHSIFQIERHTPTLAEQLNGKPDKTQLGRALDELGITLIPANSPQAKGRIERLWGTFQDRLVSELKRFNAKTIDEANAVLLKFLPDYNRKFTVEPKDSKSAWRKIDDRDLNKYFCLKYSRVVGNDNTLSFMNEKIQIRSSKTRYSFAKAKVDVHHLIDGRIRIFYKGELIAEEERLANSQQNRSEKVRKRGRITNKSYERISLQP